MEHKLYVYSKYVGIELEFDGSTHLLLKEDDIVGILETDEVKDLKPLNDRVLIKVSEAEQKAAGGLFLTEASKDKPSIGTVLEFSSKKSYITEIDELRLEFIDFIQQFI